MAVNPMAVSEGQHDHVLMMIFKNVKPGNAMLHHLNRVHLYLGVIARADICNNNGNYIMSWALTCYEQKHSLFLGQTKRNQGSTAGEYGGVLSGNLSTKSYQENLV
eukprot:1434080-Ditylum_brightwellii.AAC.1